MSKFVVGQRVVLVNLQWEEGGDHLYRPSQNNLVGNRGKIVDYSAEHCAYLVWWDGKGEAYYRDWNLIPEVMEENV